MSKEGLLTEVLQIRLTPSQMKQIDKLSRSEVLNASSFGRRHLVKTLKLKED